MPITVCANAHLMTVPVHNEQICETTNIVTSARSIPKPSEIVWHPGNVSGHAAQEIGKQTKIGSIHNVFPSVI
jgi:hypothetical protein